MTRFDVLEPYKGALKSIAASGLPEPQQLGRLLATQGWMLEAAGIKVSPSPARLGKTLVEVLAKSR